MKPKTQETKKRKAKVHICHYCLGEFKARELLAFEQVTLRIKWRGACCEQCFKLKKCHVPHKEETN